MKKFLALILVISSAVGFAQKTGKPEAYAKYITPEDLKRHLYIIAGPDMEGRETASEGQRKAAAYIENEFKRLGLQTGNGDKYQLYYSVYKDSITGSALEVNGKSFEVDKDYNASIRNIPATFRFSEVVYIGSGAVDSIASSNLAGKMVITNVSLAGRRQPNAMAFYTALMNKGIAGILSIANNYPRASATSTVQETINLFSKSFSPQIYTISDNVARSVLNDQYEQLKSHDNMIKTVKADILLQMNKSTTTLQSSDVIGVIPGTDLKDQFVVISAHYDHLGIRNGAIYYGADDDGSGTVSILEIAKAFVKAKSEGKGPRRSIIFLANSGEEEGLWGSDYYTSHPTFPLLNTTVDLNIDMVGRIDPNRKNGDSTNYVYVVGDDKLSSDLKPISEGENKKFTKLELDYKFNDPKDQERIYYRSDHYNFAKNGVPIIFYFDGIHNDYHKPTDTPDKINYELLAKRDKLVFYTAWEMANRNNMLKRDLSLDTRSF